MEITKEKNLIYFTREDKKHYIFDINNSVFYGLSGKPISKMPSEVKKNIAYCPFASARILYCLYDSYDNFFEIFKSQDNRQLIQFADKAQSVSGHIYSIYTYRSFLSVVGKEILHSRITEKVVLNYFKKCSTDYDYVDYKNFFKDFIESSSDYHLLEELSDKERELLERILVGSIDLSEYLPLIIYWVKRGLLDFFEYSYSNCENTLQLFFQYAKDIDYKPQKEDFYRQYIMVRKNYYARKKKIDSEKLIKNQTKKPLAFENENFIVKVPLTEGEFVKEADFQRNCVYTNYFQFVIKGSCNIVFIRKKEAPDIPYITCEINQKGRIVQTKLRFNENIYTQTDKQFLKEYQAYLNSLY